MAFWAVWCVVMGVLQSDAGPVPKDELIFYAAESGESTWRALLDGSGGLSSRSLFTCALAYCEAGVHEDRLLPLFEKASEMQDKDPESRGYGNFRWRESHPSVQDFNAVEFCMQAGTILWIRHWDTMPGDAREVLEEILDLAVEGCLRHKVTESYTNIALMNAENLILLGEALSRPEAAEEGYRRFERFCLYTWEFGIHEYCSPTYYGTDLECLLLTEAFCAREKEKVQARALLELFWTDIALNWFEPAQRLGGARSRDYDYLRGLGHLDLALWAAGWLAGEPRGGTGAVYHALGEWSPPERLRELCLNRFPRQVAQRWGMAGSEMRVHCLFSDVTLSCAGGHYGPMDLPLTVDFAPRGGEDPREGLRCYFIPDGRRDPYGKKKIAAGPHQKTLHLRPFWLGTQRKADALGLVLYRPYDLDDASSTLESHFVFPRDVDRVWISDREVALEPGTWVHPLPEGRALFFQKGSAIVGVRVPWCRGQDGQPAQVALVSDGNEVGALRLTVAHHTFWGLEDRLRLAGAAFWVRAGSQLADPEEAARWRAAFEEASASDVSSDEAVGIRVAGETGPLKVEVHPPYRGYAELEPGPFRGILALDGEEVGKPILAGMDVIQSYKKKSEERPTLVLRPDVPLEWEAEEGLVFGGMVEDVDQQASAGAYVWMPGAKGEKGGGLGAVTWQLLVEEAGEYLLWGRVIAPTPDDDSFFVRVSTETSEPLGATDWHTGVHETWEWTPVNLSQDAGHQPLVLPKGEVFLEFRVREDGTRLDALRLSARDRR